MPIATRAFAATAADQPLSPYSFERRDPGPDDVAIEIKYCGVCHSDLHVVKNDLGGTRYPIVPGHEIAGVVTAVGAGVGQTITQGGYSDRITVDQAFVLKIPDSLPLDAAAPLLCAGVTTWSPLKTWGVGPGSKVAVIGLGGLGHMAVKLAAALGAEVTVLSTSDRKKADAERMGARHFLINSDAEAMKAAAEQFDLIINTVSATHEIASHVNLLARDGTMVMLGLTTEGLPVFAMPLLWRRRRIAGSLIGGVRETQEMLDFCGEHGIVCDTEVIAPDQINQAYERMERSDVRYRFVIDMGRMTATA
jgi:uncharacterized zinc-type alcohol dehydrogenase-like protein